jgi:GT2 family glycosyltransferase
VDSASRDGTLEYLKKLNDMTLIENKKDIRIPTALNQALRLTGDSEYICKLDNDVVPTDNWLSNMVALSESDSKIGIVGAKLIGADGSIVHAGGMVGCWRLFPPHPPGIWRFSHHVGEAPTRACPWVNGACFLVKRQVIEKIGPFDERYPFWFEEVDYCFRARQVGFKVMYCREAVLYHYEQSRLSPRKEVYRSHQLFLEKWKDHQELWTNRTDVRATIWAAFHDRKYFFALLDRKPPRAYSYLSAQLNVIKLKTKKIFSRRK